jgi:hypothetical protein
MISYRVKLRCLDTDEDMELRFNAQCSPYDVGKYVRDMLLNLTLLTSRNWVAEELEEITGEPTMWQRFLAWWRDA